MMRVGGLASGMDIEGMVEKLMEAERMPLVRLQQQQETLTWKRDAFRDVNSKLLSLDKMMLDMKYSTTYKPKSAVSSQDKAVTATAKSSASNGSYDVSVSKLATNAMNIGQAELDANVKLEEGTFTFSTYNADGKEITHEVEVEDGDSLQTVLKKIGEASDGVVRGFYDASSKQVVLETTRTGVYNPNEGGNEIVFDADNTLFSETFGMDPGAETKAENAKFTYNNGLEISSRDNHYEINGINLEFHNVTDGNARISVSTDVDSSFDKIKEFVEAYNEAIELMNGSQMEEKYRDYKPLTKEQKAEMSEKEIEQWEEKAKSGILRGESAVRDGMFSLRQSMQSHVATDGAYQLLSQVGISTTKNYLDGGKLEIDEEKLKTALRENPDDVYKLFSNDTKDGSRGLINRFDDALDQTRAQIERQAGKSTHTLDNYAIGKQMKEVNERISVFEKRMEQVEQKYWNQFTQMEKAISNLNQQADYLYSQFNS